MKISALWLKEFIPSLSLDPLGMVKSLNSIGIGVDLCEKKGEDLLLDIEITPNRGDYLSIYGVARHLGALLNQEVRSPSIKISEDSEVASKRIKIILDDPVGCPRYTCRVITGVKVGPSPAWLVEKLARVGLNSISNVVDATNYVMWELGHPLHAFDAKKLKGETIRVRRGATGERLKALDGLEHVLSSEVLVIADAERPIALAGIMGGQESSVQTHTTDLVLESAWFNPGVVRKGIKVTGVNSDSSYRFERGTDPHMAPMALDRAAQLIVEISGGKILNGRVESYPTVDPVRKISLRDQRIERVIGCKISRQEVTNILKRLGYQLTGQTDNFIEVTAPTYRRDVSLEVDVIEDVAQLYGYEKILPETPSGRLHQVKRSLHQTFISFLRTAAQEAGFQEVIHFGLISKSLPGIPLVNPLRNDWSVLRSSLFFEMISTVSRNLKQDAQGVAFYEIGQIYSPPDVQSPSFGMMLAGSSADKGWDKPQRPYDLFDLKGSMENVVEALGIQGEKSWKSAAKAPWEKGLCLTLHVNGVEVGMGGEAIDAKEDVKVLYGEFLPEQLEKLWQSVPRYAPWGKYPAVHRDIAVVVLKEQSVGTLLDTIREAGAPWLEYLEVFDVYQGTPLRQGEKSVAFHLTFRSLENTLRNEQVNELVQSMVVLLRERHQALLRTS